jgi:hypothetical protein
LISFLEARGADAPPLAAKDLAQAADFSALHLSVIANITEARTQLRFETPAGAISRAQEHAREVMPKLLAPERWADWSWSGGEEYRIYASGQIAL